MPYKTPYATKGELLSQLKLINLLTDKVLLAIQYAERAHSGQKRDLGVSYLEEHIYPIALGIISRYKNDSELESILTLGILHDVLEDDPSVSTNEIERDFGSELLSNLLLLTKQPKDNSHTLSETHKRLINMRILEQLKDAPRPAQVVKLEDRLNNLASFYSGNTPKYQRYISEVRESFIPFAKKVAPIYEELFVQHLKRLVS